MYLRVYIYIYIYIYKTRLTSNEMFSPSNKIHREVGRAKDLSAPLYSSHNSQASYSRMAAGEALRFKLNIHAVLQSRAAGPNQHKIQ